MVQVKSWPFTKDVPLSRRGGCRARSRAGTEASRRDCRRAGRAIRAGEAGLRASYSFVCFFVERLASAECRIYERVGSGSEAALLVLWRFCSRASGERLYRVVRDLCGVPILDGVYLLMRLYWLVRGGAVCCSGASQAGWLALRT